MREHFASAPRWLFLVVLVYAPWAYGCTRPWTIELLEALLAAVLALWVASCAASRRIPRVPWMCASAAGLLLAQGWLMVANAHHLHDAEFAQFVAIESWWPGGPGAVDQETAQWTMWRVSALLGALLFTIDLAQSSRWRQRLAWTVFAAGTSLIAFGLVQRILGAPMIFWEEGRTAPTFFATFVYHANAGAFINLVLPVIAVLTLESFRREEAHMARALCVPALLITIAGAFVNVSKAAMAITVALLGLLALWQAPRAMALAREKGVLKSLLAAACLAVALAVLTVAGGWEKAWNRWSQLGAILRDNPRDRVAEVCWQMTRDSGVWGFGPGTFEITFPHYTHALGDRISGVWRYAHHDYLQTLVEWGWIGAMLWAVLIFGGLAACLRALLKEDASRSETRPLLGATALSLLGVALHARVDFPFQIASLQFYVLVFAGLGWATLVTPSPDSSRHTLLRSRKRRPSSSNSNLPRSAAADD